VNTLEDVSRTALRVFGSAHPIAKGMECHLEDSRAVLVTRETPSPPGSA
jgi:hypothetical protein